MTIGALWHPGTMRFALALLAGLGCRADKAGGGADDSASDTGPVSLAASCEPPDGRADDPIALLGRDGLEGGPGAALLLEMVDVRVDPDRGIAWGVGQGGLVPFDVSDPEAPALLGTYPSDGGSYRFHHVLPDGDAVFVTHRDAGLTVVDGADPEAMTAVASARATGLEGMALTGALLQIARRDGALVTYDVSDPTSPEEVAVTEGLGSPWGLVVSGDYAYVADNTLGVVTVDLSDPRAPVVLGATDVGAGVQDVAVGDGALYAAAGGAGLVVLDLSDPGAPALAGSLDLGGSVQAVSWDASTSQVWAVNQLAVIALDATSPLDLVPIGTEETDQWALHVDAFGGIGYVADWGYLSLWGADGDAPAPDLEPAVTELFLREEGEERSVALQNLGAATLDIVGATVDDEAFSLTIDRLHVEPGEFATLGVRFEGGEADATLCVASNDADAPVLSIALHTGGSGDSAAVGEPAIDFALEDLDGVTWRLSEQLGHPVVLVYFATW